MAKNKGRAHGYTYGNKAELLRGGSAYFDAVERLIDAAKRWVHLQTYIFDADETGSRVADALIRAAQRGVQVYLLVDGFASRSLPAPFIRTMTDAGVHFDFFQPFLKSDLFYLGRRLHHKVLVTDASCCLVAGLNISNRYNDIGGAKAWLDWAVVAEGEVAMQLNDVCVAIWNRASKRQDCLAAETPQLPLPDSECAIKVIRNDWVYRHTGITRSYRSLFQHAKTYVTLMTSYFWPPHKLLRKMAYAARKGVRVRVILTGTADVPLSKFSERYLYAWLLSHGIEIYEYQHGILHGKIAVSDDLLVTVGSYNMNNISAFASVELNLELKNRTMAETVSGKLQKIIDEECVQITEADFKMRSNALLRVLYYLAFRINHLIFHLFTFTFRQRSLRDQ